jgi:hypothetical protein
MTTENQIRMLEWLTFLGLGLLWVIDAFWKVGTAIVSAFRH